MKRNILLTLEDKELDKEVKIAGTSFDRRKKLNKEQIKKMKKLYNNGSTLSELAVLFNIALTTVKYHCVDGYKEYINAYRLFYPSYSSSDSQERSKYKRLLVKNKLI